MPVIVVANPKGGVGKSTLATNLAGWFARQGHSTMLGDTDRQQSARRWLGLRPLDELMKIADKIVVPLQPSLFDIQATRSAKGAT